LLFGGVVFRKIKSEDYREVGSEKYSRNTVVACFNVSKALKYFSLNWDKNIMISYLIVEGFILGTGISLFVRISFEPAILVFLSAVEKHKY
jgi:hypothetical protein